MVDHQRTNQAQSVFVAASPHAQIHPGLRLICKTSGFTGSCL